MKRKLTYALMVMILITFPALAIPTPAGAQGIEMGDKVAVMAKVEEIDKENRILVLRGPEGEIVPLTIGPDDPHFDTIEIGDSVKVEYKQSVALYLGKPGEKPETTAKVSVERSPAGTKPEASMAQTEDVSAKVVRINKENRTLTLEMQNGRQVTTLVDESLEGYDSLKVGDTIHARYTEAIVISLEKQ